MIRLSTVWSRSAAASTALIAALGPMAARGGAQERPDPYQIGLEWKKAGSFQTALDTWKAAADSLFTEHQGDPRIGVAFIELATEEKIEHAYADACTTYLQSFLDVDMKRFGDVVADEVRRVEPLLPEMRKKQWERLLRNRDPRILHELRRFWIDKDPTPLTPLNERLIEHWTRIAYARKTYTKGTTSPYGTDDRGTIYVKFGPPGKRHVGSLGSNGAELRRWVLNQTDLERLMRLDPNPSYAVWTYDTLNPRAFVYFLFGNLHGTGPFVLVKSVKDLISEAAISPNSRRVTPGGIRALHYFELFYYSDLAAAGGPFAERYQDLLKIWGEAESRGRMFGSQTIPTEGTLETLSYRWVQEDEQADRNPFRRVYVTEVSPLDKLGPSVRLVARQTRLLSSENEPRVVITALSAPRVLLKSADEIASAKLEERGIRHTLVVRDSSLEEIGQLVSPRLYYGKQGISAFTLRHTPETLHMTMVAEVVTGAEASDTPQFPGKVSFDLLPPLNADPDSLEMSDLVVGIEPPADLKRSLPFPVVPGQTLWPGDPVRAYLEVYHLKVRNGLARFRADFSVVPADPETMEPVRGASPTTLSFNLESAEPTSRHLFELGLQSLPAGTYQATVTITDLGSGQRRTRSTTLEIGKAPR